MAISIRTSIRVLMAVSVVTVGTTVETTVGIIAMKSVEIMSVALIVVTIAVMIEETIVETIAETIADQIQTATSVLRTVLAEIPTELFRIHRRILILLAALMSLRCQKAWNGQCFPRKIVNVYAAFQRSMLKILVFIFLQHTLWKRRILSLL